MDVQDIPDCPVYPAGTEYLDTCHSSVTYREPAYRSNIVDVWIDDDAADEGDGSQRYGKTTAGVHVDVCKNDTGEWVATEWGAEPEDFFVSDAEVEAAWKKFGENHVMPNRLFATAVGLCDPTNDELRHLAVCERCKHYHDAYKIAPSP